MILNKRQNEFFNQIYNEYSRTMYSVIIVIVKDHQLAEDALQEAFIKISKNISKFNGISPESRNLAITIGKNEAINIYNARKKISAFELTADEPDCTGEELQKVEEIVFQHFETEKIAQAICTLDDKYRIPLELYYLHGFKMKEISRLMNIPVETIKKRVQRAIIQLKERML